MKEINYVIWKEGKYYVSKCLDVEVSSFGKSIDKAKYNLREAVELYFENENKDFTEIKEVILGREMIDA